MASWLTNEARTCIINLDHAKRIYLDQWPDGVWRVVCDLAGVGGGSEVLYSGTRAKCEQLLLRDLGDVLDVL